LRYEPSPIDTSAVNLSDGLTQLLELLARNNHDLWARRRMQEGWRYGTQRDDLKKETPLLVPYEDLPENEREYDRDNARETLKVILALGGRIEPSAAK
jgi:RyR domain